MKRSGLFLFLLFLGAKAFSQDRESTIELRDVDPNARKIYVAIYNSESSYKIKPFKSCILDTTNTVLKISMILPDGFYVVSEFQDFNGNKKLDFNFWGIPKEPIWLSNYDGKGTPGGLKS